jgi:hypothetical protein
MEKGWINEYKYFYLCIKNDVSHTPSMEKKEGFD